MSAQMTTVNNGYSTQSLPTPGDTVITVPSSGVQLEQGNGRQTAVINDAALRHKKTWYQRILSDWPLDWLGLAAVAAITGGTNGIKPSEGYVLNSTLQNTAYPYRENTVPTWSLAIVTFVGPAVAIAVIQLLRHRPWRELYRLIVALLMAILITGSITNCIKPAIGRLRPHFNHVCWTDGVVLLTNVDAYGGYPLCNGAPDDVEEARRSFFSGHASWSAAGLGFLTFYGLGQLRAYSGGGHTWRLLLALVPALGAVAIGITRYTDHWHHPSDVWVGLLLGFGMAFAVYRQLYPSLTDEECSLPMYVRGKRT